MLSTRTCRGILWLAAACFAASTAGATADSGFVAAIKAQNAKHLGEELKFPEQRKPPTISRDWGEKVTRNEWKIEQGPVSVSVTLKKEGPPDGLLFFKPTASVSVEGARVIEADGAESFPDNPVFIVQIAEMDPGNPYPEVVLSVYSGGAHCCSDTRILTSAKDGKSWKNVKVGVFDGGPLEAQDIDGDGRYEFATRDNAFLYLFGCYACTTAPLQVLRLEDGELVDVSAEPAYRKRHVESLKLMIGWVDENADRNGFLAGYVAQKILLGEGREAWAFMLKHHDDKTDWGLDWCSVKRDDRRECPLGKTEMLKYPQALERFLKEAGYDVDK